MNARAELLLYVLCVCVRVLTRGQAMRLLGISDEANFKRFVRDLVARGLVSQITVWAKPVPKMSEPLFRWSSNHTGEFIDVTVFNDVIRRARARWAGVSAMPTACIVATRKAGILSGAKRTSALIKPLQATHDLAVTEVFTHLVETKQIQILDWIGEDATDLRIGHKAVDALIIDRTEKSPRKAIECVGGDYSKDKLLTIHHELAERLLCHEYW